MYKTSLSDANSNLCRDYSSFIKWSLDKISQNTEKWTDFSISEPDTLMLSSMSVMHDYAQYIIDRIYLSTDLDVCSSRFLHQASAMMGTYLWGTNQITIPAIFTNNTPEFVTINPYEIMNYENELFTNPKEITIAPNSYVRGSVVRNTVNNKIYKIDKSSNGEYFLDGDIERGSVSVSGIKDDGSQVLLTELDYIFDLLFNEIEVNNSYLLTSKDYKELRIKISPYVHQNYTAILVKYTLVDDFPVKSGLNLTLMSNPQIDITISDDVSITSDIPINVSKLNYLNSLTNIRTLCNKPFNLVLGELSKKISNYKITYEPSPSRDIIPVFEYTTINNDPLLGDTSAVPIKTEVYLEKLAIYNNPPSLQMKFKTIPPYDLIITYNAGQIYLFHKDVVELIKNSSNQMLEIDLPGFTGTPNDGSLFIGFPGLGNFYQNIPDTQTGLSFTYLTSEKIILMNSLIKNKLIKHKNPIVKFLTPKIFDLASTILVNNNVTNLVEQIVQLLYDTFIHGEIVNNTYVSRRKLEFLIKNNIPEIISIKFDNPIDRMIIDKNSYLALDTVENYTQSGDIKIITEGDVL